MKEMEATALELAGAPPSDLKGALAGTLLAAFDEIFARLDVLERAVLVPQAHEAEVVEMPMQMPPQGQPVFMPPVATSAPDGLEAAIPLIEAPPVTTRDEMLRRRQAQATVQAQPVAAQVQVAQAQPAQAQPSTPLEQLRAERLLLEAKVAALRARTQVAMSAPAVAPVPVLGPYAGPKPFEIRHVDGPLVGRADMVGFPLEHESYEGAQAGMKLIAASKPGWLDRLAIFDRRLP